MKHRLHALLTLGVVVLWWLAPPSGTGAQEQRPDTDPEPAARQLSDEDREILDHLELFENFELFLQDDLEMIRNLDIFLANS